MADLRALRASLGAFAAAVGHPLAEWQAAALTLETRTTAILAPRQSGKSRSLALLALHRAFRQREQRVLLVSAGEDASRRLLGSIRRIAADSPLLAGSLVDEQASLLRLSNGSEVRSAPASERAIRGATADLLLIDEAALVSDDVAMSAAFPTIAARPDAKAVFASTAWASGGFFYDHVHAGDSEHLRVHRWALGDAHWISAAAIESARASMSPARFAAEYEAQWSSDEAALFPRAVLERCSADLELPTLAALRGPARLLGGVDHGVSHDRAAFVAIARLPVGGLNPDRDHGLPVFGVACFHAWPAGEPLSAVVHEVAASPAAFAAVSSEMNGVGAGPTQELFGSQGRPGLLGSRDPAAGGAPRPARVVLVEEDVRRNRPPQRRRSTREAPAPDRFSTQRNAVTTSAESKAFGYERLRWLADRGQLVLPREGELLRELAALRVELRPGGFERIEAGAGHDDLCDALYLAAGPYRDRRRQQRSFLADLCDRPSPEADVEPIDVDVVATGSGLQVYRRPPLQSVGGVAVTLPVGAGRRTDPRLAEIRAAAARAYDHHHHEQEETRT